MSSDYDRIVFGTNNSNKIKTAINKHSRSLAPLSENRKRSVPKLKTVIP